MRRRDDVRARRPARSRLSSAGPARVSLARALSKLGVCSRREAERWIADGRVRVAGAIERSPLRRVDLRHDPVVVDGRRVDEADKERVVIALHKPVGLVTTRVDPGGRPTVYDALSDAVGWVFPVGRLDRVSSGLLILTNDHRLGERLTSPEAHVPKTYHARVRGVPDNEALRALREGLPLDDGTLTRPARVRVIGAPRGRRASGSGEPEPPGGSTWLELELTEGKNRQVRRMGAAVGHEVLELVRVRIGRLGLAGLAPGEWRRLAPGEVRELMMAAPEAPDDARRRSPHPRRRRGAPDA